MTKFQLSTFKVSPSRRLAWSTDYSIGINKSHLSLIRMNQSHLINRLNWSEMMESVLIKSVSD